MITQDFYVPVEEDPEHRVLKCPSSSMYLELKKRKRGFFRTSEDWTKVPLWRLASSPPGFTTYFPIQDLKDNGRYKCSNRNTRYKEWRFSELCNVDETCRTDPSQCAIGIRTIRSPYSYDGPSYAMACYRKIPVEVVTAEPMPYAAASVAPTAAYVSGHTSEGAASVAHATPYVSTGPANVEWI